MVARGQDTLLINGIDKVTFKPLRTANKLLINLVMDRDRRLTGWLRGQTDNPTAPKGYELNNPWRLEKRIT
ncbi:unnamed protein product [Blumeria hordei]|uniref:Uncharacterized protein n=1 Tax=Blumeria hordei TaxID=2867405 RepID=A0A383UM32_BLUHO|nr:unnamed protein product [Blumeria hordei]